VGRKTGGGYRWIVIGVVNRQKMTLKPIVRLLLFRLPVPGVTKNVIAGRWFCCPSAQVPRGGRATS
jgi:hypothetical protein